MGRRDGPCDGRIVTPFPIPRVVIVTGDLFATPNREGREVDHLRLSLDEELSMWALVEENENAFPLLTRIHRSKYGPEFALDRSGQDALLRELDAMEAKARDLAAQPHAPRLFVSYADGPGLTVDAALQAIGRMKAFVRDAGAKGWLVYNMPD